MTEQQTPEQTHPQTTTQVDISFSSDSGLKSARYMLERMEALPPLRPLILVLKYFLVRIGQQCYNACLPVCGLVPSPRPPP